MQRYWSEETIILFLHYKSILYNQTSVLKYSRISCQCHTNLSGNEIVQSPLVHVFLKCMTSLSRSSFSSFLHHTHYLSNQPQSQWKTDIPCWTVIITHSHNTNTNSIWGVWVWAWNVSDLVMVKSGARLSSVEVRTYFSLIKQLCHTIYCS